MTGQMPLFDDEPSRKAFYAFHKENPHVYRWLRRHARLLKAAGREHYSARTLLHAFRFHTDLKTTEEAFKINNNWSPWYARLLMQNEPDLEGFFETRHAKADKD